MFDNFQELESDQEASGFSSYEPDEPEGLLAPRNSDFFIGHEQNEQFLLSLIHSGAMPHALIFNGPEGVGKSTMAFRLARFLLKNGMLDQEQDSLFGDAPAELASLTVPASDPIFKKVASGGHPDLLTIAPAEGKNNLDVETARKVAPFLRMTSADGGWRVVIVDEADSMNRNAQNALLKILEEPPSNALLILITHRLGAMIPTIRSRCRVVNFISLEEEEFEILMSKEIGTTLSGEDKKILSFLAQGSMGRAQKLIETGGIEIAHQVLGLLETWPNLNWVDIHHLADQCGRIGKDTNFQNVERVFNAVFEVLVFGKAQGEGSLPVPLTHDTYASLLGQYSLQNLTQICDNLKEHFRQARFSNLDKRQAVLGAFNIITA